MASGCDATLGGRPSDPSRLRAVFAWSAFNVVGVAEASSRLPSVGIHTSTPSVTVSNATTDQKIFIVCSGESAVKP
ncbi:MAG: hypothetical protein ACTS22_05670 [Phycisphaerales bacterium]